MHALFVSDATIARYNGHYEVNHGGVVFRARPEGASLLTEGVIVRDEQRAGYWFGAERHRAEVLLLASDGLDQVEYARDRAERFANAIDAYAMTPDERIDAGHAWADVTDHTVTPEHWVDERAASRGWKRRA